MAVDFFLASNSAFHARTDYILDKVIVYIFEYCQPVRGFSLVFCETLIRLC